MTINTPSFFAGVGTVLILLTFGFGGGVLVSGMLSETVPREPNRVERRAAATEAAPPTITTKAVPVVPAPTDLRAPTPNSDPPPKSTESANAPVAQPQNPALAQQQARSVTPAADPVSPPLGPQQPVALVNPDQAQDRGEAITQQAKRLADEMKKNAERRKKAERPRQRETRQARQQRAPAGSSAEALADGDVRERSFFMLRERHEFGGPPLFRFFGNAD